MTWRQRLVHELVIQRATAGGDDDYGQPTRTWSTLATVQGLVQPKSVREVVAQSDAGVVVSDHTIYLDRTDVTEADRIVHGERAFEVRGVRDYQYATPNDHLEIDVALLSDSEDEGS